MKMVEFYTHLIEARDTIWEIGDILEKEGEDVVMLMKIMAAIKGIDDLNPILQEVTDHATLRRELLDQRMRDDGLLHDKNFNA